jgi:hypothetical protein
MDLAALFRKHGSDKEKNGCSHVYSVLFDPFKSATLNILEIGIGTMVQGSVSSMKGYMPDSYRPGASLRAWKEYFSESNIYGIDIQKDTQFREDRIQTHLCDSTNVESVRSFMDTVGVQFDIIIDDGWHLDTAQRTTLANFFPHLREGGLYIIEDISPVSSLTRHGPYEIRKMLGNYEHFFVGLKNNQCVIRKRTTVASGNC